MRRTRALIFAFNGALAGAVLHADSLNQWEGGVEAIIASDVNLFQTGLVKDFQFGDWDGFAKFNYGRVEIDYEPVEFDLRGESLRRDENSFTLQLDGHHAIKEDWTLLAGAGAYAGYTNYRSVWIDEYFYQQYSRLGDTPGLDTYEVANPKGVNVSAGARWEYLPASGFAELTVSWLGDDVSPGYEIDFDGLRRGRDRLSSVAASLSLENVLSRNVRSRIAVSAVKTTERDTRYGINAALNCAISDRWIARFEAGAATEDPQFDSFFGNASIEYEATSSVTIFASTRYYEDTGEIENALLFTSSAPGMDSRQVGAGVRWIGDRWSARLFIAPLKVDYEPTNPNTDFFQNLYKDRDWTVVQFAVGRSF